MLQISFNDAHSRAALVFSGTKGNLITAELVAQLRQAAADLAHETTLKLVTLEGEGADFSFGASVPEHAPGAIERVLPELDALAIDWLGLPMPTAAVVRGRCLGGGFELALACDFILADDTARFGLPEITLGVFPPIGSVLLPERVGRSAATSAVLSGAVRPAAEWHAAGLTEWLTPAGGLATAVDAWFEKTLASKSAAALRLAVQAVRGPLGAMAARELPALERLYLDELMQTEDAREGLRAFMEKRPPRWRDR